MIAQAPRKIAVIGGGGNDEHEVSLASAAAIVRAVEELPGYTAVPLTIDEDRAWRDENDTQLTADQAVWALTACESAFPALHGVRGEDGTIAGLLDLCGVPCVGSPVRAGALGMDKYATKMFAHALGIPTARAYLAGVHADSAAESLTAPFVVKPSSGGSSNGVCVVADTAGLAEAVQQARSYGDPVLIEEYVSGQEVDIAVFRDRRGELRLGATLEIGVRQGGIFGAAEKYDGSAQFTVPATIDRASEQKIRSAATAMYQALGCAGVARFDF